MFLFILILCFQENKTRSHINFFLSKTCISASFRGNIFFKSFKYFHCTYIKIFSFVFYQFPGFHFKCFLSLNFDEFPFVLFITIFFTVVCQYKVTDVSVRVVTDLYLFMVPFKQKSFFVYTAFPYNIMMACVSVVLIILTLF